MFRNRRQESLELGSTPDEGDVTSPKWGGMDCHMEHRQEIPRLSEMSATSVTPAVAL